MEFKDEIWVLIDKRPGTATQAIALAEKLSSQNGLNFRTIHLTYSFLAKLPNFLLNNSLWRLSRKSRLALKNRIFSPSIIISSGRRSAPIALYLKNNSPQSVKIIQIMNPNLHFSQFDFLILPKHDKISKNHPNIIKSIGSLTRINDNLIKDECEKFSQTFNHINKPKIALFIGGDSKNTKFTSESALNLAKKVSHIANNMKATLIITNSRRTSETITQLIQENLTCDFQFFDWHKIKDNNPYFAIIGYADFFIATGDSVSMISESCSTGKPVYIFDEKNISSKKQRQFHQDLFTENYAHDLSDITDLTATSPTKKLEETNRISSLIRLKF